MKKIDLKFHKKGAEQNQLAQSSACQTCDFKKIIKDINESKYTKPVILGVGILSLIASVLVIFKIKKSD